MKCVMLVFTAAAFTLLVSCGNNSADKNNAADTATSTTSTTTTAIDHTYATGMNLPATTRTVFETKYPQASNVRWEYYRPDFADIEWDWSGWPRMDTADYTASFNYEGNEYWAMYDQDGNWIGSINRISNNNSLPEAINTTLNNDYKDYTVVSIDRENDKDRTAYEIQLEKADARMKVLIDENGKVLKKKAMSAGSKTKDKVNPKDTAM